MTIMMTPIARMMIGTSSVARMTIMTSPIARMMIVNPVA